MAFKVVRVNNSKITETRLYRLLDEKELPIYLGSTFMIEQDEQGAFWLYIMTLKEEDKIHHDKNTQSSNRTCISGYNAAVCNANDICR